MVDAVLFDFFGTVVEYEPDRANLHYGSTFTLLESWGHRLASHEAFVELWDGATGELERDSSRRGRDR